MKFKVNVDLKKSTYPNPLLKANYLNKLFFWWLKDIIWYGKDHDFMTTDLYDVIPEDLSNRLICNLESNWADEISDARCKMKKKPSLWKAVMKTYGWDFMKIAVLPTCAIAIRIIYPEMLKLIILYFKPMSPITPTWAYFNATTYIFLIVLQSMIFYHGLFYLERLGMQAKIACTSLIYRKLTRLSSSANQKSDSSVISLLSVDVTKFEYLFTFAPFIIIVPMQLIIVTYMISRHVGFTAAFAGIATLILQTIPIQAVFCKINLKYRAKQITSTDHRISLISEICNGIRAVKMYVWEEPLRKLVYIARKLEIANYIKISHLTVLVTSTAPFSYRLSVFAITLTFALQDGLLTAEIIPPVMQHLINMRAGIAFYLFLGLKNINDMCISMNRIEEFLLLEEFQFNVKDTKHAANKFVSIENVTALRNNTSVIFKKISLNFIAGKLYAVIGSVGSGKSSLLQLILGELPTASGEVIVCGKVSYVSQEPWLFNGSIRDNILFGEVYDEEMYHKTVNACALREDFNQLLYGDKTLVGERGSNLSGGQRARVHLARAVYRQADIYLLDNPLSAVDTLVGNHIMKECINGLLQDKIRILVTHGTQEFHDVAEIIVLEHGEVEFKGNIKDFYKNNKTQLANEKESKVSTDIPIIERTSSDELNDLRETEEVTAKGSMKTLVYLSYIKAGGWNWLSLILLTNVLFVIAGSLFDFGLGTWNITENSFSSHDTESNAITYTKDSLNVESSYAINTYALIFGSLITFIIFITILKSIFLYKLAFNASKNIHNDMLSTLMKTTLRFFDANSTDIGITDDFLPRDLCTFITGVFNVMAVVVSIIITNWWVVIPCSVFVFISLLIGKVYMKTKQNITRLLGNANSPILSFAASSLEGMTTIRACKAEPFVIKDFDTFQDQRTSVKFLSICLQQSFVMWGELIYTGLVALMTYLFVFIKNEDTKESYVGLTLMQVMIILQLIPMQITTFSDISSYMVSVERMLQFKELEQESSIEDKPILDVPSSWPNKGEIVFEHLYLRYSNDSEPVLWDLNFRIKSGSKIGIVGRTGAGKSSLISALFRFAKFDGFLLIDGLNIKEIPLYELRSKMSIIPQEPIFFKTSLRKNLDPLDKFDDSTLYSALESVELKSVFGSLNVPIERGGSNMSVGQRQLLCLARAILHRNKILILDEATANIDSLTDALIQKTIRSEFKDCTVLTIAHRLNTVMDSDKILVLDAGRSVEYDHPFLLLQNKESHLFKMVQQGGEATIKNLTAIAEKAYNNLESYAKVCHNDDEK